MKKKMLWTAMFVVMLLDLSSCWVDRSQVHYYNAYDKKHEHDRYYRHYR